jgi:hypothetical protein
VLPASGWRADLQGWSHRQTADYARAVIQAARPADEPEQIEEAVAARLERQAILDGDDPPRWSWPASTASPTRRTWTPWVPA